MAHQQQQLYGHDHTDPTDAYVDGERLSDGSLALDDFMLTYIAQVDAHLLSPVAPVLDSVSDHHSLPQPEQQSHLFCTEEQRFMMREGAVARASFALSAGVESARGEEPLNAQAPILSPEEREVLLLMLQGDTQECTSEGDTETDDGQSSDSTDQAHVVTRLPSAIANPDAVKMKDPRAGSAATLPSTTQQSAAVKKLRRDRRRPKHEVDFLRRKMKELKIRLEALRRQMLTFEKAQVVPHQSASTTESQGIWEQIAKAQREEARTAMIENVRLRSQYMAQLQIAAQLDSLYRHEHAFAAVSASLYRGMLSKRARHNPFDDDFAIFASLGRDFDAQYSKIDAILDTAGLTDFDGVLHQKMQPKRGTNGIFCLEDLHSQMIPFDMHLLDRVIWHCATHGELQKHHSFYEIRETTETTNFTKIVDTIRLPHTEATLTVRMALKRYIHDHRVVGVWDTVIEVSGAVSLRLRERGWNMLRPPRVAPPNQRGPISIEQACVRTTPEGKPAYSAQDLAEGTLSNMLAAAYHQHMQLIREVSGDLLATQFEKFAIT